MEVMEVEHLLPPHHRSFQHLQRMLEVEENEICYYVVLGGEVETRERERERESEL